MSRGAVSVVALDDVEPIELPQGSWSRMLVTSARAPGNASSLGYSVFKPGTVLAPVKHETEEVAYVVAGSGELRLDDETVPFHEGDALHIPAGTWHAVANTGDSEVVMVFGFPHRDYPPTEKALMVAVAQGIREQVAWACRILASEGYADLTLGHVSARGADGQIWIKRKGVALDEVEAGDVVAIDDTGAALHLETVLHTGVYGARPDVGAVVHGHPPYATALGATSSDLAVLTHDGILFADGVGRFDEPDLIVDDEQGNRVATALGSRRAVLLNNHGVLVVGKDVPWVVLTAATLERAARLQAIASTIGELQPIGAGPARQLLPVKYRDEFVVEYWAAWQRRIERDGGGLGGDLP